MTAMEEHEGFHHKKETRKEHWVRVTTVGFSDGARPLIDLPVKLKRDGGDVILKTNSAGQLKPLVHHKAGQSVELWIENIKKEWVKLETVLLGSASRTLMFVCDQFEVCAPTRSHNPPSAAIPKSRSFRYVVQPGDTLEKIARKFRVKAERLQGDNGIKNPDLIVAGQTLMIKTANPSSPKNGDGKSGTSSAKAEIRTHFINNGAAKS